MRLIALTLAVASAAWLAYAMAWFLAWPSPGRGFVIRVPAEGEVHFARGTLGDAPGGLRRVDFGPWWIASLRAAVAVLLPLALRSALAGGDRARGI